MRRRLLSVLLALMLLSALFTVPAAAAGQDLVITQDTLLRRTGWFVLYNSITVKSGATLTIDKEFGFEIANSLVLEPGAKLLCNGTGSVEFQFSMKYRGSTVTGVDLYYPQRWDDGAVTYERIPEPFADTWDLGVFDKLSPRFKWNPDCGKDGGWCLTWSISGNPFNIRFYHMMPDAVHDLFLLRVLGYDDTGNQVYDNALALADELKLLTRPEEDNYAVCVDDFWRADMVVASTRALDTETVSGGILADQPGIRRAGAPTEEPPKPAEVTYEE